MKNETTQSSHLQRARDYFNSLEAMKYLNQSENFSKKVAVCEMLAIGATGGLLGATFVSTVCFAAVALYLTKDAANEFNKKAFSLRNTTINVVIPATTLFIFGPTYALGCIAIKNLILSFNSNVNNNNNISASYDSLSSKASSAQTYVSKKCEPAVKFCKSMYAKVCSKAPKGQEEGLDLA